MHPNLPYPTALIAVKPYCSVIAVEVYQAALPVSLLVGDMAAEIEDQFFGAFWLEAHILVRKTLESGFESCIAGYKLLLCSRPAAIQLPVNNDLLQQRHRWLGPLLLFAGMRPVNKLGTTGTSGH